MLVGDRSTDEVGKGAGTARSFEFPYHFLQASSCLFHLHPIRPCFPKDASSLLPGAQQAKLDLEKV